ncbi:MAG TPA: M23 family metallopeptidase [Pyrinomonadaceae bacterium]|nr:M23 family metallopeptidase [Pyrinomonadaceae bacterium]
MGPWKLRILLCVLFLVIVSIVSILSSFRTTPRLPAIDLPPSAPIAIGTPLPPTESPTPAPEPANFVGRINLIIPVAGVRPEQLLDTYSDARSEGRTHDAIDIMASAETPVLAAADGKILKLFQSERGGITIYQLAANQELVFYYAHLSHYADGLTEGSFVKQSEVIAYVGDTGNAGSGNYHLHFSIALVTDPKRYWEGTNINPYPLLQNRPR